MIRKALGFLLIGILLSSFFWNQSKLQAQRTCKEEPKLSPVELQEFNQFVEKLNQRLRETRDVSFLLDEMIGNDYGHMIPMSETIDDLGEGAAFLSTFPLIIRYRLFREVSNEEIREFWCATWNFMFLRHLIALGNCSLSEFNSLNGPPEKVYPAQVTAILKTKPYFIRFLNYDEFPVGIKTVEEFREATKLLSQMAQILRETVQQSPPEKGKFYAMNISEYNRWGRDYNEPFLTENEDPNANIQIGERAIHITLIPSITIGLVKRGDQFKIYYAQPYLWW